MNGFLIVSNGRIVSTSEEDFSDVLIADQIDAELIPWDLNQIKEIYESNHILCTYFWFDYIDHLIKPKTEVTAQVSKTIFQADGIDAVTCTIDYDQEIECAMLLRSDDHIDATTFTAIPENGKCVFQIDSHLSGEIFINVLNSDLRCATIKLQAQ